MFCVLVLLSLLLGLGSAYNTVPANTLYHEARCFQNTNVNHNIYLTIWPDYFVSVTLKTWPKGLDLILVEKSHWDQYHNALVPIPFLAEQTHENVRDGTFVFGVKNGRNMCIAVRNRHEASVRFTWEVDWSLGNEGYVARHFWLTLFLCISSIVHCCWCCVAMHLRSQSLKHSNDIAIKFVVA